MRKLLALLLVVLFASSLAFSADTEATGYPKFLVNTPFLCVYHVTADDSNALSVADTSWMCPTFPRGFDYPMPDNITLRGNFTEIGTNTSGDCTIVNIDTSPINSAKASSNWVIISETAGDAVYANRTGNADTIDCAAASTASHYFNYSFTDAMKAALLPYFRIRWGNSEGAAADSFDVDWYVIYTWDNDPD